MKNPYAIDQAYVVSLKAIRETFQELSSCTGQWLIEETHDNRVVLSYDPDGSGLNRVSFEFPIIANIALFDKEDGILVCLYPMAVNHVRRGLYWEDGELKNDDTEDWMQFWGPFETALYDHQCSVSSR